MLTSVASNNCSCNLLALGSQVVADPNAAADLRRFAEQAHLDQAVAIGDGHRGGTRRRR